MGNHDFTIQAVKDSSYGFTFDFQPRGLMGLKIPWLHVLSRSLEVGYLGLMEEQALHPHHPTAPSGN